MSDGRLVPDPRCFHGVPTRLPCPKCKALAERRPPPARPPSDERNAMPPRKKDDRGLACDQLCDEITSDVCAQLANRVSAAPPGVVAAFPLDGDQVRKVVRAALDLTVQFAGPMIESGVLASRDQVRELVSPRVLEFLDGLIHDLQGKAA